MTTLSPSQNTLITGPYTGAFYAFTASGGYVLEEGFDSIRLLEQTQINQYDMTNAVQVLFDVRTFNQKLGLYKDAANIGIVSTTFDSVHDTFQSDSITLSAQEFVNGMSAHQIVSVGSYSTMYSDFVSYINAYFGYAGGFSSLFNGASEFNINNGLFDASALMNLITNNGYNDGSGGYITNLSGTITVSNINATLRYAVDSNVFGNRSTGGNNDIAYYDACGNFFQNYGASDGFIAGDLIFLPTGTQITLNVNIAAEPFLPVNNVGPSNVSTLTQNTNYGSGNFCQNTRASTTNINRVLTAPLLIKLANLSGLSGAYIPPSSGLPSGVGIDGTQGTVALNIDQASNGISMGVTFAGLVQSSANTTILTSTGIYYNGATYSFADILVAAAKIYVITTHVSTAAYYVGRENLVILQPGAQIVYLPTGLVEGTKIQISNYSGGIVSIESATNEMIYSTLFNEPGLPLQMVMKPNTILNVCYIISGGVGSWVTTYG
jgi:hypothetical protein